MFTTSALSSHCLRLPIQPKPPPSPSPHMNLPQKGPTSSDLVYYLMLGRLVNGKIKLEID